MLAARKLAKESADETEALEGVKTSLSQALGVREASVAAAEAEVRSPNSNRKISVGYETCDHQSFAVRCFM